MRIGKLDALSLSGAELTLRSLVMSRPNEILLVEDYEPDAQLLQLLLRRNHVLNKVHVVADGNAALDFVHARGAYARRATEPLPMVVIMDIRLPKMDGWEVLRRLRQDARTREMPVIMVSGSLFQKELDTAHQLGANACISKPIKIDDLREALGKCSVGWLISKSDARQSNGVS